MKNSIVKKIYAYLQDEQSVKIFENRLLHSLTEKPKYIGNIVALTYGSEDKWNFLCGYDNIVVYGTGNIAKHYQFYFERVKEKIAAFCDRDEAKQKKLFCGYKVISPKELEEKHNNSVVVIALWDDKLIAEITEGLLKQGFLKNQILAFKREFHKKYSQNAIGTPYFDPAIVLPKYDEVFIDAGCFDCNTSVDFTKWNNAEYKKIIAFEPNPEQYSVCREFVAGGGICNMTIYPYGLWNENAELSFKNTGTNAGVAACIASTLEGDIIKIKVVKLDDILNGDEATFIKMDIEGAELNALKGAEQTILKYRPKLAICVYHKPEDIWEIPAYILSLHKDYKFYLRHYSIGPADTVLYAV